MIPRQCKWFQLKDIKVNFKVMLQLGEVLSEEIVRMYMKLILIVSNCTKILARGGPLTKMSPSSERFGNMFVGIHRLNLIKLFSS